MNKEIIRRLDSKLVERTSSSPIAFIGIAFIFFFFQFGADEYNRAIVFFAAVSVSASIVRFIVVRRNQKIKILSSGVLRTIKAAIIFNGIAVAFYLNLTLLDIGLRAQHALSILAIATGLTAASMITLSPALWVFIFFNLVIFAPLLVSIIIFENEGFSSPLFWLIVIQIIYVLKQGGENRKTLIENIKSDMELENSKQEIIEQTTKAIHSSRLASLGEMAAGIAHEINNPLAIIQASVEQLMRGIPENLRGENKIQMSAQKIRNSVSRIEKIVKGLRTFSKQNDADPMLKVGLKSIIQDTLDFCFERLRSNGIELELNCPQDFEVKCRPVQISQILINLINNASDALGEQGLLPEEKKIVISCRQVSQDIFIEVCNSGKGISEESKRKLFQPFYTTKEIGKGTGLGLSISKNIANHHGGDLFLDQSKGMTTFCLRLPVVL